MTDTSAHNQLSQLQRDIIRADELPANAAREEVVDFARDLERRMRDAARLRES